MKKLRSTEVISFIYVIASRALDIILPFVIIKICISSQNGGAAASLITAITALAFLRVVLQRGSYYIGFQLVKSRWQNTSDVIKNFCNHQMKLGIPLFAAIIIFTSLYSLPITEYACAFIYYALVAMAPTYILHVNGNFSRLFYINLICRISQFFIALLCFKYEQNISLCLAAYSILYFILTLKTALKSDFSRPLSKHQHDINRGPARADIANLNLEFYIALPLVIHSLVFMILGIYATAEVIIVTYLSSRLSELVSQVIYSLEAYWMTKKFAVNGILIFLLPLMGMFLVIATAAPTVYGMYGIEFDLSAAGQLIIFSASTFVVIGHIKFGTLRIVSSKLRISAMFNLLYILLSVIFGAILFVFFPIYFFVPLVILFSRLIRFFQLWFCAQ